MIIIIILFPLREIGPYIVKYILVIEIYIYFLFL